MSDIRIIDLHMHTKISDGTDTPAEILEKAKSIGLEMFSITDHDAIKSGRIMRELIKEGDPIFVNGVEFSCSDEEGKYHILGYGYNPEADSIRHLIEKGHSYRMEKLDARLDYLKTEYGFDFPQEELDKLHTLENPGKPHIGNLMVQYGYADNKNNAIHNYINHLRIADKHLRPEEAIEGILGGGGIPVLAHPISGDGDQLILGLELELRVKRLINFGIKGLEVFYFGYTPKMRAELIKYADLYNMYVTAGSDYHGTNKMIDMGDTGLDEVDELPEGMKRFIDIFS
jgi:hypothetical protein